jgi:hypothetical protein
MTSFDIAITYSQISIFNSNLENPFNDWEDEQVAQGFSWREQSVSFKTLTSDEVVRVELNVVEQFRPSEKSLRTISVPFTCNQNGAIEISSITDSQPISLEPGEYQLVFEAGLEPSHWCRISLIANGDLDPKILVADSEITPSNQLVMGARSA